MLFRSRLLDVTPTTVHNWRRGAIVPTVDKRAVIETHTGGAVGAAAWVNLPSDDVAEAS